MARMSIDDKLARDTRVDKLARLCGWSRRETRACLEDIWAICYDRVVPYLTHDDIELAALRDAIAPPTHPGGFVPAIIDSGLARRAVANDRYFTAKNGEQHPWKDQQWRERIYLSGASDSIGYLLMQSVLGKRGGQKSAETRWKSDKGRLTDPATVGAASSQNRLQPPIATAPDTASASSPDTAPDKRKEETATSSLAVQVKPKRQPKQFEATDAERASVRVILDKLGEHNGVAYTYCDAHTKLIVRQLRAGVTEADMRQIVWHKGPKWGKDSKEFEDTRDWLCPETLFGPEKISKYIEPARAAYKAWREDRERTAPKREQPSELVQALVARGTENDS